MGVLSFALGLAPSACGGAGFTPSEADAGEPAGEAGARDSGSPAEAGIHRDAGTGTTDYAPYYEIGANTSAFTSLVDLQKKSGLNEVTLAFVLSGGNCSTDGTIPGAMSDIKAFVAAGGHVKASFGGADGTYVEAECADATSLAKAISNFVDATGITDLDFDIEQAPVLTDAANLMRGQALKMVQDSKNIQVSFTLEADPDWGVRGEGGKLRGGGLNSQGISVVTQAVAAGVKISHVNMMIMDFGSNFVGMPLAPISIASMTDGNAQLRKIIPGLTIDQAWRMIGATPEIGRNDDGEVFSIADAQALAAFAIAHKLGLVSFWSIQRDAACSGGRGCSGYDTTNFAYDEILQTVQQ
jgi:chitinase